MSRDACVQHADSDGRVWSCDVDVRGRDDARCVRECLQRDADVDGDRRVREQGDSDADDQRGRYDEADDFSLAGSSDDRMSSEAYIPHADGNGLVRFSNVDVRRRDDAWCLRERLQRDTDVDGDRRLREQGDRDAGDQRG